MAAGRYGQQLAQALHATDARSFVTYSTLVNSAIAVTEVKRDAPEFDLTSLVPYDDAFIVALNMRDWPNRVLWIDDKPVSAQPFKAGVSAIFDLRRKYIGYGVSSFHLVTFYLPRRALSSIAEIEGMRPTDDFGHDPCVGVEDRTIRELGFGLSEAFKRPVEANPLFLDHVTTAVAAHLLGTYGLGWRRAEIGQRRLSERQERRAKEMLASRLDGDVTMAMLANECGLGLSSFRRAFAATVGQPPHRWLLERRIEKAMALLRGSSLSLPEIAVASGFVDERHLNRVFRRATKVLPQEWRRTVQC
jgi:AraC family transcriptional regulator